MLQVLLATERWRIISAACPAEAAALDIPRHTQWMHGHSHSHLFQRHTGRAVHQYINDCRWERVELMRQHGESQKRIGLALGFACESSFSRWLRQQKEQRARRV